MIRIEVGGVYEAKRVRSGTSSKGDWELIVVKPDKKGERREVTLYVDNCPSGIREGDKFRVRYIESVSVNGNKGSNGEWLHDKTSMTVNIDIVEKFDPCDVDSDLDMPEEFRL